MSSSLLALLDNGSSHLLLQDRNTLNNASSSLGDGCVALFVRMLGLDNDPLDREQAVVVLWKYSLGGKQYIDAIMQFRGCLNLIVNLLKPDSSSTCEAAAGLLREISSVNLYRESVAESGAIEEITGLLSRSCLTSEVWKATLECPSSANNFLLQMIKVYHEPISAGEGAKHLYFMEPVCR